MPRTAHAFPKKHLRLAREIPTKDDAFHPRRILVGLAAGPNDAFALQWAEALATAYGAQVHVLTALANARAQKDLRASGEKAARRLRMRGVPALSRSGYGPPTRQIVEAYEELRPDLIILGGRKLSPARRFLLGSVSDGVRDETRADFLLARGAAPPKRILAATDGTPAASRAVDTAVEVARTFGADLRVLEIFTPPPEPAVRRWIAKAEGVLRRWSGDHRSSRAPRPSNRFSPEAKHILQSAQESHADLTIVGSRGLRGVQRTLRGSVSNRVAHFANRSVLLLRDNPRRARRARERSSEYPKRARRK